ncbi:MAG: acylphosphatase [Candidatus Tectimicrobiota bacterium]
MRDKTRRGFIIRGQVQGVGFRWWTFRNASRLGLRGTVRNRVDGSVEVCVEGPPPAVEEMRALLKRGPTGAWVTSVDEFDPEGVMPDSFEIVA